MMNLVTKILPLFSLILLWLCLNGINLNIGGIALFIIIPSISYLLAFYIRVLPTTIKIKVNFIWYFFWLIKEIFKSTLDVLKIIWRKDMNLSENMQWLSPTVSDESFLVIYGNSITLTPGTVTLDIKNDMLLVHSLMETSFEDLKKGDMENRIKNALHVKSLPLEKD